MKSLQDSLVFLSRKSSCCKGPEAGMPVAEGLEYGEGRRTTGDRASSLSEPDWMRNVGYPLTAFRSFRGLKQRSILVPCGISGCCVGNTRQEHETKQGRLFSPAYRDRQSYVLWTRLLCRKSARIGAPLLSVYRENLPGMVYSAWP